MQALRNDWRTPGVVILCGGVIVTLSMGIRHAFGLFLQPMSADLGWGREVFSLALALQNLVGVSRSRSRDWLLTGSERVVCCCAARCSTCSGWS